MNTTMVLTLMLIFSLSLASDDLSKRLENSFDTTPLGRTQDHLEIVDKPTQVKSQSEIEEDQYYSHMRRQKASTELNKKTVHSRHLNKKPSLLIREGSGETPFNSPTVTESYPYDR